MFCLYKTSQVCRFFVLVAEIQGLEVSVDALAWNKHLLTAGCSDGVIICYDVRSKNKIAFELPDHHSGSINRLAWSRGQREALLLSACIYGKINLWDTSKITEKKRKITPKVTLDIPGPVSVLSWCPWTPHANLFVVGYDYQLEFYDGDGPCM